MARDNSYLAIDLWLLPRACDRRSRRTAESRLVGVNLAAWHHLIAGALDQ